MIFHKYNSIENTYREENLQRIEREGFSGGTWVASEKLHGANFSFHYDGKNHKEAKRSGFIEEGENFYACSEVVNQIRPLIRELWGLLLEEAYSGLTSISVYGELFGDGVQKGISYGEKKFYAFDMAATVTMPEISHTFMYDPFKRFMGEVGIPIAPEIATGTLQEMLELSPEFDSKVLGIEDNLAEGLVIKPVIPCFLASGSRVILKHKAKGFSERSKPRKKKSKLVMSDEEKKLAQDLVGYCNTNRIESVVSKIGQVTIKDFGKVFPEFIQDVWEDVFKDYPNLRAEISEMKALSKHIQEEAKSELRIYLLKQG